jgi:hypothetical protein
VSEEVQRRYRVAGNALDQEKLELTAEGERLNEVRGQIEADRAGFEEDVAEYNRTAAEVDARFPPSAVESGIYREAIRTERGRVVSASREIRVYRFVDQTDLVRVLAHELGHSLGLGHVAAEGALMSEQYGPREVARGSLVKREDVDALIERCTELFEVPPR